MDGEQYFTITHPFHPYTGQQFPLLYRHNRWGEIRVGFHDPITGQVRSIPAAWTDLTPVDPFIRLAAGYCVVRLVDLQALVTLLDHLAGHHPIDPNAPMTAMPPSSILKEKEGGG